MDIAEFCAKAEEKLRESAVVQQRTEDRLDELLRHFSDVKNERLTRISECKTIEEMRECLANMDIAYNKWKNVTDVTTIINIIKAA